MCAHTCVCARAVYAVCVGARVVFVCGVCVVCVCAVCVVCGYSVWGVSTVWCVYTVYVCVYVCVCACTVCERIPGTDSQLDKKLLRFLNFIKKQKNVTVTKQYLPRS